MKPVSATLGDYSYQISKGSQAEQLLKDEFFNELILKVEAKATEQMVNEGDAEARNQLWHRIQAIRSIKAELSDLVAGGKIAAKKYQENSHE